MDMNGNGRGQIAPQRTLLPLVHATVYGAVAGLRSMAAPAALSGKLSTTGVPPDSPGWLRRFGSPVTARALAILATGELVADKVPGIPARTRPLPLAGRALAGALCGYAVGTLAERRPLLAGLLGGGAAVAMAFAGVRYRRTIGRSAFPTDAIAALAEDALVVLATRKIELTARRS
ncbi:MAG TPA: DUF4126 family protein [Longimicrobiales bacterium]|nr:DUF4126 family protein [Longimicrobiales bacterium]